MHLAIDGAVRDLIPLKTFRANFDLAESFSLVFFEPKDFQGLASIDHAGAPLNDLRQALLNNLPAQVRPHDLLSIYDTQQALFRAGLYGINALVGLKTEEIEFAVAGFGDSNRAWVYAVLRSLASKQALPSFSSTYQAWLNDSVRISQETHAYGHQGENWQIQVLNYAYGRIGLRVSRGESVDYVLDSRYTCPAEGYMMSLLTDLAASLASKLS